MIKSYTSKEDTAEAVEVLEYFRILKDHDIAEDLESLITVGKLLVDNFETIEDDDILEFWAAFSMIINIRLNKRRRK